VIRWQPDKRRIEIVIRRILEHPGLRAPRAMQRSAPLGTEAWPVHASLPLTHHPIPDIARAQGAFYLARSRTA